MSEETAAGVNLSERDLIEHYFDRDPHERWAIARQAIFWLAFEHANGLMSERVFSIQVWITAARNGFPPEHAKIWAKLVVDACRHTRCNYDHSSENEAGKPITEAIHNER